MSMDDGPADPGDAADAADRLTRLMEDDAIEAALSGDQGHEEERGGTRLGAFDRPLDDLYDIAAAEGSDDASDDPFHAGGLEPDPWMTAEQAAMHVVDERGRYVGDDDRIGGDSREDGHGDDVDDANISGDDFG